MEPNIQVVENKDMDLLYQDELEQFFINQEKENTDQVIDPEEVDSVLDGLVEEEEIPVGPTDGIVEIDLDLI